MPDVKPHESQSDYVERCIPVVLHEGTAKDGAQASAICHSMWKEHRKSTMTENERLLTAVVERHSKQTEWNGGILTADAYIKTLQSCVGSDLCYRYAAKGNISFDDILTKAAKTLTYNNRDMLLEESFDTKDFNQYDEDLNQVELPKNTLMVFRHVLTTNRKDRDGDVLRTKGAKPDPKMLLLWQHVHTLPIGKMLSIAEHTPSKLSMVSAIVDVNELAHDAAVMIDNKMGRFSHGFKALEFMETKDANGKPGGFDIKSFEIMEESLVSVPANIDASTEEVILSLVSGGKLTSPMMKGYFETIKEKRPTQVSMDGKGFPLKIDLELTVNGKPIEDKGAEIGHEQNPTEKTTKCNGKPDCGCGCSGSPKKTDDDHGEEGQTNDKKVELDSEKAGRVLNSGNLGKLQTVRDHLSEIKDKELLLTRGGRAMCNEAHGLVDEVIKSSESRQPETQMISTDSDLTIKDAQVMFIAGASFQERKSMISILSKLNEIDEKRKVTEKYLAITGRNSMP